MYETEEKKRNCENHGKLLKTIKNEIDLIQLTIHIQHQHFTDRWEQIGIASHTN